MSQKKIEGITSFLKKNFFFVLFISTVGIGVSIYWVFYTPRLYAFWPNYGLGKVATFVNPSDPDLFFAIGESHFGHGKTYDIKKAETAYINAIELRPDFLEAHYQLGRIHFINGKFSSALAEMDTVLHLDPEFKRAYYMTGLINGYKGDLNQAIWGFSEFIKRDDFNWAGYNDLAWIYFKKGDYQEMKETAEKGLEQAYHNPWLSNIYGTALMNLGDTEKARENFHIALDEIEKMTPEDWGRAYPGNNPAIYATGLEETKNVIRHNLELVERK